MPITLDQAQPLSVLLSSNMTPVISVQSQESSFNYEEIIIQHIANLTKPKLTTGTLYYDAALYLNGDTSPAMSSGVYKQSLLSGQTSVILNLADFYNNLTLLQPISLFTVKVRMAFYPEVTGKVSLSNQRLHVEAK
jgi:hypothetical protein